VTEGFLLRATNFYDVLTIVLPSDPRPFSFANPAGTAVFLTYIFMHRALISAEIKRTDNICGRYCIDFRIKIVIRNRGAFFLPDLFSFTCVPISN
jgi:hypothetical protein